MHLRACRDSFTSSEGLERASELAAASVFEAAVLGLPGIPALRIR